MNTSPFTYFKSVFSGDTIYAPGIPGKGTPGMQEANFKLQDTYNRSVSGQIIARPNVDTRICFFVKDFFGVMNYIGSSKIDIKGNFHFQYCWREGDLNAVHELTVAVIEKRRPFAHHGLFTIKDKVTVDSFDISNSANSMGIDIGVRTVNYMNSSTELAKLKKPAKPLCKPSSQDLKSCKTALTKEIKEGFVKTFRYGLSSDDTLELSNYFGPNYPKSNLTPENLIDDLLNHICAVDYITEGKFVYWEAYWKDFKFENENTLPNVKVIGEFNSDNKLVLKGIAIWFPEDNKPLRVDLDENQTDPEKLKWALYVARSVFALMGEAELHLAEGHLLAGVPAKAFFKNIKPSNPIYGLLAPCLKHVETMDEEEMRNKIFGKDSQWEISALKRDSLADLILMAMAKKADFLEYEPMKPLCGQHKLAKAEARHFNLLRAYFSLFLKTHWKEVSQPQNWLMIYQWSSNIHKNFNAIPMITENQENPTETDLETLSHFLSWLVNKATFRHWAMYTGRQLKAGLPSPLVERRPILEDSTLPKNVKLQNSLAVVLSNFGENQFLDGTPEEVKPGQREIMQDVIEIALLDS